MMVNFTIDSIITLSMGVCIGIPSLLLSFMTWWEARRARLRLVAEGVELETIGQPFSQIHDISLVNCGLQNPTDNESPGSHALAPPTNSSVFMSDHDPETSVPTTRVIDYAASTQYKAGESDHQYLASTLNHRYRQHVIDDMESYSGPVVLGTYSTTEQHSR
ncbi:hypothetical protein F4679DRAFT_548391 [Xylaria curta]|nr:hypothetical protein F4679DRAFT_548391 [Xylaria curta]